MHPDDNSCVNFKVAVKWVAQWHVHEALCDFDQDP